MWRYDAGIRAGRRCLAVLAVAGLAVTACSSAEVEPADVLAEPATVEALGQTGRSEVRLTARAIERLGLRTVPVERIGRTRTTVPYSAVLYDANGGTWAFVRSAPRSFVRQRIAVLDIDGDVAVLSDGPGTGTEVVSVGAAELYGAELGVDH